MFASISEVAQSEVNININDESDGYTRIRDMAKQYGVTLRALRFYEEKGLLNPTRDGVNRLYSGRDHIRLKMIMFGRKVGFSLREIKQMLDLYDPSSSNRKQIQLTLNKSKRQLVKLKRRADELDEAIILLSQLIALIRSRLEMQSDLV